MKIAVTQRVEYLTKRDEYRDALDHRVVQLIVKLGCLPILIPNSLETMKIEELLKDTKLQGIILTGGNNIGDFKSRDRTETKLLNYSINNKIPLVSICRGMQLMNIQQGGSLKPVQNHANSFHKVRFLTTGHSFFKNSFHNFSIDKLGFNFSIDAISEDGEVEAIKHNINPHYGIMWHPEREKKIDQQDTNIFKKIFKL